MLFDVERMTLLIVGDVNISRRTFLEGKLINFGCSLVLSPIPRVSHEGLRGIILGDNPAKHCFVLRDLGISSGLFLC